MPRKAKSSRAKRVYKAIIDQIATDAQTSVSEDLIREQGCYSKARDPSVTKFNRFVKSLSAADREILCAMLRDGRETAIGEALATLQWWVSCRRVRLTVNGERMPTDLLGNGIHVDFAGRFEGWLECPAT